MQPKQINAWAVEQKVFTSREEAEIYCKEQKLRELLKDMSSVDIIEGLARGELIGGILEVLEG